MKHQSQWEAATTGYPPLPENLRVDVLVVGGGITGVSTAFLLARAGARVALLERYRLGQGDTGHTTAHLTYMTDTRLSDLLRVCGETHARNAWDAGRAAIAQIHDHVATTGADAGMTEVDGYLAVARACPNKDYECQRLRDEAAWARQMDFEVEFLNHVPPTGEPGLRFPGQAKFHPLRYLHALAAAAAGQGAHIHEHSNVATFECDPPRAHANGHRIDYQHLVIATHVPLQGTRNAFAAALLQTKLASYSTYALAARAPAGSLPPMIWSDTAEPFHYLRVDPLEHYDLLIYGGADHKTGHRLGRGGHHAQLEESLRGFAGEVEVVSRWSGQVVETIDGLPYIGEAAPGMFLATGYSGNGMTFGTVAAMMARDWVLGRVNPWCESFAPDRWRFEALPSYLRENSDFPRHLLADRWLAGASHPLLKGEGHIIKSAGQRIAVCRDATGRHHTLSAVCPHMGCIVAWNPGQLTWDCPCHGSRFAADGNVIAGPAESRLEPVHLP